MSWLSSLSDEDKREMYTDACNAYITRSIGEIEFRLHLAKLGYNATDIEDEVIQCRRQRIS